MKQKHEEEISDKEFWKGVRSEERVTKGDFVYYVVVKDTNIRLLEHGIPVIFATEEAAEIQCSEPYHVVISVANYNNLYLRFMI